jgi:hypothetical protein
MAPGLRLHGFVARSRANGPGIRAVVWTQGCTLGCPGCFNPGSHPLEGPGGAVATDELATRILALRPEIEGLTVSGGEPLQQWDATVDLLASVFREGASAAVVVAVSGAAGVVAGRAGVPGAVPVWLRRSPGRRVGVGAGRTGPDGLVATVGLLPGQQRSGRARSRANAPASSTAQGQEACSRRIVRRAWRTTLAATWSSR